ncbi:MAG: hypothetical protein JHC98_10320 [Thermoleophilaceae bacterium]|nr:hypothetical protein [Thermoleophilaceae bacterium]
MTYNAPDTTDPVVTITAPSDGAVLTSTPVAVTFTVTDNEDPSPTCTRTSGDTFALVEGANTITVDCTDASGNTGSDSVTVTYNAPDTEGPTVLISEPTPDQVFTTNSATLHFTVTDNEDPSPTCDKTDGESITLTEGANTITVVCTDASGNPGQASVNVTYEPPLVQPTTDITDPLAASPTLTPTFNVSSDTPSATFECSINGSAFAACDPATGTYGATFNNAASNEVQIRAKNGAAVDATPVVTHIWTDTRDVQANASVLASDQRAGAHPATVDGTISLEGGYNAKSVTVDLPIGLNGALTATDEKCDASGGDAEAMDCASTAPGSAIGTLTGVGVATTVGVVSDAATTLYLTTPPPDSTSPAGVWADVTSPSHPELGHIRAFGWVNIVQRNNGVINGEIRQSITIPNIPEVTSAGVRFHASSVSLQLLGDPPGGTFPLITNPTTCTAHSFEGDGTTWSSDGQGGDGPAVPHVSVDYPVTDCGTLEFNPVLNQEFFMPDPIDGSTYDPLDPSTNVSSVGTALESNLSGFRKGSAGTIATLTNGEFSTTARRAAMRETTVLQPQGTGATFAALSGPGSTCPGGAASATGLFDVGQCSPGAQVGTISISTPLLEQPLEGTVWFINNTPLPWLGIYISPDTGANNPAGVYLNLTARTDLDCAADAPQCSDATYKRVKITLENLPDVPMDSATLDLSGRTPRSLDNNGAPIETLVLAMPDAGSTACRPSDNIYSTMLSGSGATTSAALPTTMGHCPFGAVAPTLTRTSPTGSLTNQTTATFNLVNNDTNGATLSCKLDQGAWEPCDAGTVSLTALADGQHTFAARAVTSDGIDGSSPANSTWTVDTTPPPPLTTLTKGAANSGTVTFSFTGRAPSTTLLCSRDGAPFSNLAAQCGSPAPGSGATGTFTWSSVVAGSGPHTFSVQVRDLAGNVSSTKTASWTA